MASKIKPNLLRECFADIFAYVQLFKQTCVQKQPSYSEVKQRLQALLGESAKTATDYGIDPREYDEARFAIVAWVDETVMLLPWAHKTDWQRAMLQMEIYGTSNGGEEFFERLNRISPNLTSIREIYYVCLCLGFVGRYCHAGDEILIQQLKLSNVNALLGARANVDFYEKDPLFNCAYESLGGGRHGFLPKKLAGLMSKSSNIMFIVLPLIMVISLYLVYNFVLDLDMRVLLDRLDVGGR